MIYLTKNELVENIAVQTERAVAVIEHTDFSSGKLNPNSVIIPFLCNIFDSALIVMALEENSDSENDCHRNALNMVMRSLKVKTSTKNFIRQIQEARQKYTFECTDILFDSDECLDFLNAYDCFMFDFIRNSETVRNMNILKFSSLRNMVEKLLKKNIQTENKVSNNRIADILEQHNRILSEILTENRIIRKSLDELTEIIKSIDIGGRYNEQKK